MDQSSRYRALMNDTVTYLRTRTKTLFLTTSNRWVGEHGGEKPKSTQLAYAIAARVGPSVSVIEVPDLNIYPCEGNVSTARGNTCGVKSARLADRDKNPTGHHRCWASVNNPDDELWKVSKALLASDSVIFFGSIRWGQMNSFYQKLIERLTWIENRHSTLGEDNIVDGIDAGVIAVGQNWRGADVVKTQRDVLDYFGFRVVDTLCWNWQYLTDEADESEESYRRAATDFRKIFLD